MSPIAGAYCSITETRGRILVRWGGEGFDAIKADFRRTFPRHRDAIYLPTERAWSLPAARRSRILRWIDLWFEPESIHWAIDWDDAGARADEEPGPPPRSADAAALAEAYAVLYLTPQAPRWAVNAIYRAASKHLHPDHGGSHAAMVAVNAAVALIRQHQGS